MKKLNLISFLLLLIVSFSCTEKESSKLVKTEKKKSRIVVKTDKVMADRLLTAKIQGMMCEKGCGSSIRKELMHTDAVESCEFDFESDRKENMVKIAFDKDKITADKLISILNSMNEKQFKVSKSQTSTIETKTEKPEEKDESSLKPGHVSVEKDEARTNASDTIHETPNLLQIFSRIITG